MRHYFLHGKVDFAALCAYSTRIGHPGMSSAMSKGTQTHGGQLTAEYNHKGIGLLYSSLHPPWVTHLLPSSVIPMVHI